MKNSRREIEFGKRSNFKRHYLIGSRDYYAISYYLTNQKQTSSVCLTYKV